VRNLPDGRVEVAAQGEAESIDRFERALHHGPRGARVERVETFDDVPGSGGAGFSVR
jgi:acylphosphatase